MFFPEKIISIKETDKVLEVGPGGTPYPRSDVLLEKFFSNNEASQQRGHTEQLQTDKQVVYYDGGTFPFNDDEFDYVICSHVLEHIHENNFDFFVQELHRVAKKGYIEFPTIYYEYLYNYDVHITIPFYKNNTIYYLSKDKIGLVIFRDIQQFFRGTSAKKYVSLTNSLKQYYFQGFEWSSMIHTKKAKDLQELLYDENEIIDIPLYQEKMISCKEKIIKKIIGIFK